MSGHHPILVIHAPRPRSRLNAALISARWVSLGEVPLPLSCAADLLGIQAYVVGVGEHLLERQPRLDVPERARQEGAFRAGTPSGLARGLYR